MKLWFCTRSFSYLETLHVKEESECFDDHGRSFPEGLRATGTLPLPANTPAVCATFTETFRKRVSTLSQFRFLWGETVHSLGPPVMRHVLYKLLFFWPAGRRRQGWGRRLLCSGDAIVGIAPIVPIQIWITDNRECANCNFVIFTFKRVQIWAQSSSESKHTSNLSSLCQAK